MSPSSNSYGKADSSSSAAPPSHTMASGSSGHGSGSSVKSSSSYSPSSYGSGSANWNKGSYDSCVQRMFLSAHVLTRLIRLVIECVAQFGSPSSMYMPPSTTSSGSSGNGKTHTVIVAPTQGVLRYVPFALNASVGDTVKFVWGANVHTVTKSSQLSLCNKTGDQPFASGSQNKTFVCKNTIHLLIS